MSAGATVVLVAAGGAAWEATALEVLGARSGVVVLKRCVDVDDLLAAAASGQADAAVVGLDAHGLDLAAVDHVRRHGVRPVGVVPAGLAAEAAHVHAARIGLRTLVDEHDLASLPDAVTAPERPLAPPTAVAGEAPGQAPGAGRPGGRPGGHPDGRPDGHSDGRPDGVRPHHPAPAPAEVGGRVLVVWGPGGAPGRTTVATTLATVLSRRRLPTLLVDADPWGGAVAQQLGVLDEVSGLLAAARLAGSGVLAERLPTVLRGIDEHLAVVTGLPRPDRWSEVREGTLEHLLDLGRGRGHVVVDTGASLESDPAAELAGRPSRNALTLAALDAADELLVVGTADPVGLSRLASGLVDLRELTGGRPVRVLVNRWRDSLGWSERDVEGMVRGFGEVASLHVLPDDQAAVDRALVAGRSVAELDRRGQAGLAAAVEEVADALVGRGAPAGPGAAAGARQPRGRRLSRRRAGRAHRR